MRHKVQKEALDDIVQKMANDVSGDYLGDLLKAAKVVQAEKRTRGQVDLSRIDCLKNVAWLYGYENEVQEALEAIKSKLEKKIFNKESSHVTIISCMACYSALSSILVSDFDDTAWDKLFAQDDNKRLSECLEILQRHCPDKIDVEGFCEARRYIRIWDSAYNW